MENLQKELKEKESKLQQIVQNNQDHKETNCTEVLQKDIDKLKSEQQNKDHEYQKVKSTNEELNTFNHIFDIKQIKLGIKQRAE